MKVDKRKILIDICRKNGKITTKEANNALELYYYHNHKHYVSEILSRLVKKNVFKRVSNGVYELGSGIQKIKVAENQQKLF